MKIWFIHHYLVSPDQPGIMRPYLLAAELKKLGHKPALIGAGRHHRNSSNSKGRETFNGVEFLWLKGATASARYALRILNMITFAGQIFIGKPDKSLEKPDLIIANSPDPITAFAALRLARRKKIPFILHLGDLWPQALQEIGQISRFHPVILLFKWIEKYLYRNADAIISPLPESGSYVESILGYKKSVIWIPNGVDLTALPPPSPMPDRHPFTFIYAGGHGEANDLDTLLDAIGVLQKDMSAPDIRFRFIGSGPEKPRLMARAARGSLDYISFENPVSKENIYQVLAEANAFVICFPDYDFIRQGGLAPNKLFDYMAMGRPTILASPAKTDPISENNAGICVPACDPGALARALIRISTELDEVLQKQGQNARAAIENFYNYSNFHEAISQALEIALSNDRT